MATTKVDSSLELWKDVPGYEGYYQISDQGRVKSLERSFFSGKSNGSLMLLPEGIKKVVVNADGYECVGLSINGKETKYKVHKLVALAFIGNPENKDCVDHINTIRADNRVENLRWCTRKENMNNHLTLKNLADCHRGKRQVRKKKIAKVDPDTERIIHIFDSALAAGQSINVGSSWILKACKKYPTLAHGFIWKYVV